VSDKKTAIVTGASQGIGAGLVEAFLKEGYSVVAMSRNLSQSLVTSDMTGSPSLVLVDGDIAKQGTAAKTVDAAIKNFGTVEVLVNNAGISSAPALYGLHYRRLQLSCSRPTCWDSSTSLSSL